MRTSLTVLIASTLTVATFAQPPAPGLPTGVAPAQNVPSAPEAPKSQPSPDSIQPAPDSGNVPPEILAAAKDKQRVEYAECKSSYDYWCKEVTRLSAKADPNKSHLVARAQGKVKELAAQAKELISPEYLDGLVQKQLAAKAESEGILAAREKSIQKDEAIAEAERQRMAAAAARARQKAASEAETRRVAALLREAKRKAQEAADKETWGIITPDKYNRAEVGMDISGVEKILGPGVMLSSQTSQLGGTVTDYKWTCTENSAVINATFHGSRLANKQLVPITKHEYQLKGTGHIN